MTEDPRTYCEARIRTLFQHVWDSEIQWAEVEAWLTNFVGKYSSAQDERNHAMFSLSCFMYFSRRMIREMLRSLYRDKFESRLIQRIRRANGDTKNMHMLRYLFNCELEATQFIGVGNPSESGAHLLYFFRQINKLEKDRFVDLAGAFESTLVNGQIHLNPTNPSVRRYVFFDDLVASGTQVRLYLLKRLAQIRAASAGIELSFLSLFATTRALRMLNQPALFNGNADCLFELDNSYRAFSKRSRYFATSPAWFEKARLFQIAARYGNLLAPGMSLGYKRGQLLLAFSHNTPDNVPPIFWSVGKTIPWKPVLLRYQKLY